MRESKYGLFGFVLLMVGLFTLTACATQPEPDAFDPPGFWRGYWHGLTVFFALIGYDWLKLISRRSVAQHI